MSVYRLDITGSVNLKDYGEINGYIDIIDSDDKLTITLDSENSQNITLICSMIEEMGFTISSKNNIPKGKVCLTASRNTG